MCNELLIWEDLQGSGRGLIEVLYWYLPKGMEETTKNFSFDSRYPEDLPKTDLERYRYTNRRNLKSLTYS
jgi:hypothetical protein